MPLLDHFHPPLTPSRHWESIHAAWAGAMADLLNKELLPVNYFAEELTGAGTRVEIDVATFQDDSAASGSVNGGLALQTRVWAPPAPAFTMPAVFPHEFKVLVFAEEGGTRLVAAVELVSPANKDRQETRNAFVAKCASYLCQGISLIVVDIVTSRQAILHNELMQFLQHDDASLLSPANSLYAVAYRPIKRDSDQIDCWLHGLKIGEKLPTLPLALNASICLPLDLEATYVDACQRRRLQ